MARIPNQNENKRGKGAVDMRRGEAAESRLMLPKGRLAGHEDGGRIYQRKSRSLHGGRLNVF
jgi:hypothetical protein